MPLTTDTLADAIVQGSYHVALTLATFLSRTARSVAYINTDISDGVSWTAGTAVNNTH